MMRVRNNSQYRSSVFVLLLTLTASAVASPVRVGDFVASGNALPAPWKVVGIDKRVPATRYRTLQWDGRAATEARANASMALLARPLTVDLQTTPVLS